jgi:hypothetical protein
MMDETASYRRKQKNQTKTLTFIHNMFIDVPSNEKDLNHQNHTTERIFLPW